MNKTYADEIPSNTKIPINLTGCPVTIQYTNVINTMMDAAAVIPFTTTSEVGFFFILMNFK